LAGFRPVLPGLLRVLAAEGTGSKSEGIDRKKLLPIR
jgi:hypothetical protein